ncbi:helix-turn-helix domain-containing protein [Cellulomonas sp. NPDC055163]
MVDVGVAEAARMLDVSPGRVRQLISAGRLPARRISGRWIVDLASLPSAPRRGRPMSPRIAWALVELGEDRRAAWTSSSETSRLRGQLDRLARDQEPELLLRSWLASRAVRHVLSAPDAGRLRQDSRVVLSGISDPRSRLSPGDDLEAYVHDDDLAAVRAEHLLVPARASRANVVLHASPILPAQPVPLLLLAADLAEHDSDRELSRSRDLLVTALQAPEAVGA